MSQHGPPHWIEKILERILPPGLSRDGTLGDLSEGFTDRAARSVLGARIWYGRQAASLVMYTVLTGEGSEGTSDGSGFVMDVRWSLRSILKNRVFSSGVVAALALGLGAITAVFSVVDGTFRNTGWWRDAETTMSVWPDRLWSRGELSEYQRTQAVYVLVGGFAEGAFSVQLGGGESISVNGVVISPGLFGALGVQPQTGRGFSEDDAYPGGAPVVVLGEALWRRSFGADPGIVGSTVTVNGGPFTVIGIEGRGGIAPGGLAELWIPLVMDARDPDFWPERNLSVVGVLRADADIDAAQTDLEDFILSLIQRFPGFYPPGYGEGSMHVSRADEAQRRLIATPLLLLLSGTALLMLVTALNVGNLLLGRAVQRRKELALRMALGAGRTRIVRQLLVEGVVWMALSVLLGLAVASIAGRAIADLFVGESVVVSSRVLSPTVLAFILGVSILSWLVLSGVPIAYFLRSNRTGLVMKPQSGARA